MAPVVLTKESCVLTKMTWKPSKSCSPILETLIQCDGLEGEGDVHRMQQNEYHLSWTMDVRHFEAAPFFLKAGDKLRCHVRQRNKHGWSILSYANTAPYLIQECADTWDPTLPTTDPVENVDCQCGASSRLAGRTECCQ